MKLYLVYSVFATLFVAMNCKSISKIGPISPYLRLIATVDGKSYFADNVYRSWFQSENYCKSLGMTLASITTKNQADALQQAYHSVDFDHEYWISGRDAHLPRQFSWGNGQAVSDEHIRFEDRGSVYLTCLIYVSKPNWNSNLRYYECSYPVTVRTLCETGDEETVP